MRPWCSTPLCPGAVACGNPGISLHASVVRPSSGGGAMPEPVWMATSASAKPASFRRFAADDASSYSSRWSMGMAFMLARCTGSGWRGVLLQEAMTDRAAPQPLDELLARRDWVRRFARTLARDDATADDLAQDAMLAAIEHTPRDAAAPAGWFRRVLLRRAMNRSRGERRRDEREAQCARRGAAPSSVDVVSTAESHRRVVEAV